MDLYIDIKKLSVGGWWIWIITSALVLFLSFEIEIGDGPGPELDNILLQQLLILSSSTASKRVNAFLLVGTNTIYFTT